MIGIVIAAILLLLAVLWIVSTQRSLAAMEENIGTAMNRIGVQLSSCFDALTALLELTKDCAGQELRPLIETVGARRSAVTARSLPGDVRGQEDVISGALHCVRQVAEKHPELKADEGYRRYMSTMDSCKKMVRTSRLIYNDSVTRLNRAVRMFPTCLLAGILGFRPHDYLEAAEENAELKP